MTEKTKKLPLCWKCDSKITEDCEDGGFSLVGCKGKAEIHNYKDAEKLCPVLNTEK